MPDQTTSEDGETTSVEEAAKHWFEKNKKIIIGGSTALAVATGVFISLAKGLGPTEDTGELESATSPVASGQKRQSPSRHHVVPHQRRARDGSIIDVPGYERGASRV